MTAQRQEPAAGPELNAEIAVRIFGWQLIETKYLGPEPLYRRPEGGSRFQSEIPPYSSDIAAAMTVFEALVEMTGWGEIQADMEDARGEGFVCAVSFGFDETKGTAMGRLPEAICRAALALYSAGREDDGG